MAAVWNRSKLNAQLAVESSRPRQLLDCEPDNLNLAFDTYGGGTIMKEAFQALREFFVGAGYSVFAAGCVLAVLSEQVSYLTIAAAFIFSLLLIILGWMAAVAGRNL
jgi:hypothetical protein